MYEVSKNIVYAFTKLSTKSHNSNILCTMDVLGCPTRPHITKILPRLMEWIVLKKKKKKKKKKPARHNLFSSRK